MKQNDKTLSQISSSSNSFISPSFPATSSFCVFSTHPTSGDTLPVNIFSLPSSSPLIMFPFLIHLSPYLPPSLSLPLSISLTPPPLSLSISLSHSFPPLSPLFPFSPLYLPLTLSLFLSQFRDQLGNRK